MDGFLRPFNSISVISGLWKSEHERLYAMKRHLGSERISPLARFEPATPWAEVASLIRLFAVCSMGGVFMRTANSDQTGRLIRVFARRTFYFIGLLCGGSVKHPFM